MSMYQYGGNSHDRRKAKRAELKNNQIRFGIKPENNSVQQSYETQRRDGRRELFNSWVAGNVVNFKTGTVALALHFAHEGESQPDFPGAEDSEGDYFVVKRKDNRRVIWAANDCERHV